MSSIAFIGLGNRGGPRDKNLLQAGGSVTALDVSEQALGEVVAAGATAAAAGTGATTGVKEVWSARPAADG
mgnify:CR=1 FL=1